MLDELLSDSDVESEDSELKPGVFNFGTAYAAEDALSYWERLSDDGSCTSGSTALLDEWSMIARNHNLSPCSLNSVLRWSADILFKLDYQP